MSTGRNPSTSPCVGLDEVEDRWRPLFVWAEQVMGGRLVSARRQARWRPCWFLTIRRGDGEMREVYLRTQREGGMPWTSTITVEREFRILTVLQGAGVLIPRIHGFFPDPQAILMDVVPGRDRFDARDDQATRDNVLLGYVDALAHAHAIDPRLFEEVGLRRPATPEEIGLGGFALTEKWYREAKPGPDPLNEFIINWIHRRLPLHRQRVCWNAWDAGQFLHHEGRCTAVMDIEFSMLGDPLNDLAAMRFRDTIQPIGDLTKAYARYAEVTGETLDRAVINYQAVRFSAVTSMLPVGPLHDPPAEFDYAQWAAWHLVSLFVSFEIMAEELGIDLEFDEDLPTPAPSRRRPWALAASRIVDKIVESAPMEEFDSYTLAIARDLLPAVLVADDIAEELEARDRDDEERLLGRRPRHWQEADALMEAYVRNAGPEEDALLVRHFYRRIRRQWMVLRPSMREMQDFEVQRVDWTALAPYLTDRAEGIAESGEREGENR
jgi:aminoglycoside phosphotransferase (APT) family kinase protein